MHTEIQKALLPNPTTIVHWKKNHLGAKRQLFSHIGRKINWISNSFSRTYYYPTTYFSIYYKRETKKVIILIHLLSKERPVFSSPTLLQTVFYTETLLVRTLRMFFFMVSLIFCSPFSSAITFWDPHLGGRGPCKAATPPIYLAKTIILKRSRTKKVKALMQWKKVLCHAKALLIFLW